MGENLVKKVKKIGSVVTRVGREMLLIGFGTVFWNINGSYVDNGSFRAEDLTSMRREYRNPPRAAQ